MSDTRKPNRLLKEKSPYLQQHAYNPVDWYPWGDEAIQKAKRENKPILVSIGYSTCHWCHVMERESYENEAIAARMNDVLVNIKVDREERPDVDKVYMTAVSAMTGSGGWPLNVFLTPDLKPFFGGTYFPPAARWGHPGWPDVVDQIGKAWQVPAEREKMLQAGDHIAKAITQYVSMSAAPLPGDEAWLNEGYQALKAVYDATNGGFGRAPKFPMPVYHNFLLRHGTNHACPDAITLSTTTLRRMAEGGIYDHLGGGFARYSTDERWHVPHFEKMLYDNAQLATSFLEAFQITGEVSFRDVARETLDYVARDLQDPAGGFYSAEDADSLPTSTSSEKVEGAFYVWEGQEVVKALGDEDGALFSYRYGVRAQGNVLQDPHGEFREKNVLYVAHPIPEIAREFKRSEVEVLAGLNRARKTLFLIREGRPRPHRDEKVISAWNGLMISAYAKAFQVLHDATDLGRAVRAAEFIFENLYDAGTKRLYRSWCQGQRSALAISDDYAFMVQGLIELYKASLDVRWLIWAEELLDQLMAHFFDPVQGGFYMTATDQDANLIMRVKEDTDNVEPSASSIAVSNLLRMAQYTGREDFQAAADLTLRAYGHLMKDSPQSVPQMLAALDLALAEPRQVVLVGKKGEPDTEKLHQTVLSAFAPDLAIFYVDSAQPLPAFFNRLLFIKEMRPLNGKATAYVCLHHTCDTPTSDPEIVRKLVRNAPGK